MPLVVITKESLVPNEDESEILKLSESELSIPKVKSVTPFILKLRLGSPELDPPTVMVFLAEDEEVFEGLVMVRVLVTPDIVAPIELLIALFALTIISLCKN